MDLAIYILVQIALLALTAFITITIDCRWAHLTIGELWHSRAWGIRFCAIPRKRTREGDHGWTIYWCWHFPVPGLIWSNPRDDLSTPWTGRSQYVRGLRLGFRHWIWA